MGVDVLVALLAEGVDRNANDTLTINIPAGSPSSRRAWIEMQAVNDHNAACKVALLAEGVDRNRQRPGRRSPEPCRPPRGGRG